jgi:hypothetical protein
MGDAGISDWVKLGVKVYDVHQKQKNKTKTTKSSNPSAVRGGSGTTKLGIRDKYGPYANLALEANELATGGGDSTPTSTPGYRTGRKIERVESTINIGDLKKISLDEEDDSKFYA